MNQGYFRSLSAMLHMRHHHCLHTGFLYKPSLIQSAIRDTRISPIAKTKILSARDPALKRTFRSIVTTTHPTAFGTSSPLQASLSTLESERVNGNHDQLIPNFTDELNPSQKEATLRPRYSITRVIAGPGAGKTRVLTCRMGHLLLDNSHLNDPHPNQWDDREGILAVTFTKKAAMEMERRLTELLSSATQIVSPSLSSDPTPGISTGDEDLEEGEFVQYGNADPDDDPDNDISRQLMRRTTVGTFHSVCSKILRKFGKELGDLPSVRNCVGAQNASGATVVQAGIQTGSPEDEERSINQMLIQTLDGSFNILDQSDQLRLLKEVLQKHNIQLKSPASSSGGRNNDIRPITVLNAISLLNTNDARKITSQGGNGKEEDDISNKMSKKVQAIATEIQIPFQKAKYTQNSIDFDDLILLTRELLLRHPGVREVLHRRWRHILVDEFQDTSQVQLDLVRLLTTNSLFVVGDGDQSIYSWRGASPESLSDFEVAFHNRMHGWEGLLKNHDETLSEYLERISGKDVEKSPLKVKSVYLMENYRSTTNIVKAAQRIISASDQSDKKNQASAQDNIRRDMKPMRGTGPSPRVLACKDSRAEANFVVKTVNSMIDSGDLTPSSTVALIYRTNAQSRLLEEACVEHNLRYVVRGSSGTFYKRAEIQDCMSFLKVMYNPRDRSAWARAVKAPSRGIGEASLNEFFRYCDAITEKFLETNSRDGQPTPLDVLISLAPSNNQDANDIGMIVSPKGIMSTRSMNRFIPFASSLRSLRRKAEAQGVPDFLLSVIEDLGLKGHFDSISKTRDEYEDRLSNVMELVRAAERYKDDGPCIAPASDTEPMETPLGNFLDDVALIADLAPDESDSEDGGRVVANLMTIHSSKGMEFDAVLLVGNEEGTFPSQRSIAEGEGSIELSEERRLCYVAMTRAKTHLVLTWRREVSYFAGASFRTRDADRSRFLDILTSKQRAKSNKGGSKPRVQARSNKSPARNMDSMTKRELHTEANRYLASSSKSWDGVQARSNNIPARTMDSMTKRELHTEANRYPASSSKSWDDWEPTSQKKPIGKVPSIKSNGLDQRRTMTTSSPPTRNRPSSDRRQVMPSPRDQNRPEAMTSRRGQMSSSQPVTQSKNRRQKEPPPQTIPNRAVPKRPSQTTRPQPTSRNIDPTSLPEMDSTMFYPVGSPVKHKLHGRGIVQTPPSTDAEFAEKMLVRVKFTEDNIEWDMPMDGLEHTFN
ncbi:hypothetical protein ACHAXR_006911 [Thalassiosira sp. AJA248-18]